MRRDQGGRPLIRLPALILFSSLAVPAMAQSTTPDPLPTPFPPAPPTVTADPKEGFALRSGDGSNRVRLTGYAHADGRFFTGDDTGVGTDSFLLRRLRPAIAGTLGGRFDFQFMPDFGGGTAVLQDGYVDSRFTSWLRMRVGKFKAPAGLERLHSATGLLFVERGFPTALLPNRDVGVQLHGELLAARLTYQAGVFNGVPDGGSGDVDTADGKDFAGRVWVQPWRKRDGSPLQGLGLGVSATTGRHAGSLPAYRSTGQVAVFTYATGVSADGLHRRYSPQASFTAGPARLLFEWARSTQRLRKGIAVADASLTAWQVAGGCFLTGEASGWGTLDPKDPFLGRHAGRGAVELAARYGVLEADEATFTLGLADPARAVGRATEVVLGVNWWLTRAVKYVVDVSHTRFEGGAPAGDRPSENALLARVQVAF